MILRGFRYRLEPTNAQEVAFRQFSGVCRLVYNLALEQRREFWRQYQHTNGRPLNYVAQARELTDLRSAFDWIADISQACQQQALRDLDKAFVNFFRGTARHPTPRKRGINDSFRFPGRLCEVRRLNAKWSVVKLPKIGFVKFRDTRAMRGTIKNVTIVLDALGWNVVFTCEIEHAIVENIRPNVGIDRGISNTLMLSTGESLSVPATLKAIERRHRSAQRAAARGKRGSIRHAKALRRAARLSARAARIRRDWQHKASSDIARRFGHVVVEDLRVKKMTAAATGRMVKSKAGLNRAILNQGWYTFEALLIYKLAERGGTLLKVNPAYTSQTCSECGAVDRKSRKSQAVFACQHCGFHTHADHNAAINILRRNTALMRMEEGHGLSGEVRTRRKQLLPENLSASVEGGC